MILVKTIILPLALIFVTASTLLSQWSTPVLIDSANGVNFQIGVANNGTIALGHGLHLYISTDHGRTFSDHMFPPPQVANYSAGSPYVLFDSSNTIWLLWAWMEYLPDGEPIPGNEGNHLWLMKTSDMGASFQTVMSINLGMAFIATAMIIDGNNMPNFVRDTVVPNTNYMQERLIYSIYNPVTDSRFDKNLLDIYRPEFLYGAAFALDGDSLVHFVCATGGDSRIIYDGIQYARYFKIADQLSQFTNLDTSGRANLGTSPYIAIDGRQRVLVAYLNMSGYVLSASINHGQTFSIPISLYQSAPDIFQIRDTSIYSVNWDYTSGTHYLEQDLMFNYLDSLFIPKGIYPSFTVGPRSGEYLTYTQDTVGDYFISKNAVLDGVREKRTTLFPSEFTVTAFPNPFNPSTHLYFNLPTREDLEIEVYNQLGQRLETHKIDGLGPGIESILYEPKNLATGVLFVRVVAGWTSAITKLVFLK
jgi:hypothetical protein